MTPIDAIADVNDNISRKAADVIDHMDYHFKCPPFAGDPAAGVLLPIGQTQTTITKEC
jgi:hypothetical protein